MGLLPEERTTQPYHSKLSVLTTQVHHYVKQKGGKKLKYNIIIYMKSYQNYTSWTPTKSIYAGVYNGFKKINYQER